MEFQDIVAYRTDRTADSGVGGCVLDDLLEYVNALPAAQLAAVVSGAWWRAMGYRKMGARSRIAEMYIVSIASARIAEEGLLDLMNHY